MVPPVRLLARPAPAIAVLLAGGALAGQAKVWVVDDNPLLPGVDFASIQEAVHAAAEGDTVLVRHGAYAPFAVVGKGLAVVGEPDFAFATPYPTVSYGEEGVLVQDVPAGSSFALRGLRFASQQPPGPQTTALRFDGCAGQVRIDHCQLGGLTPLVRIEGCALVSISDCDKFRLRGQGSAIVLEDDTVSCDLPLVPGGDGLEAARLDGCLLAARNTILAGAFGDPAGPGCVPLPGAGGTALVLDSSGASLVACDVHGGTGGVGPSCSGDPGQPFALTASLVAQSAGQPPAILENGPGIYREGASIQLRLVGSAGDLAWLAVSPLPGVVPFAGAVGVALVGPASTALLPLGAIADPLHPLTVEFAAPELGAGVEVAHFTLQGVFLKSSGIELGSSRSITLLDVGL